MSLSKTQAIAWIMTIVGALGTFFGIDYPADVIEGLLTTISDDVLEVFMLVLGPIVMWLRSVTSHPVVQGLKGLLFREDAE